MVEATEANDSDSIEAGDRVIHPKYGTGDVVRADGRGSDDAIVDFNRAKREVVNSSNLKPARTLLREVEVAEKPEWQDEAISESESAVYGGEVEINLDFADGVAADVDARIEDGCIIVQYWEDEEQ